MGRLRVPTIVLWDGDAVNLERNPLHDRCCQERDQEAREKSLSELGQWIIA